MSNISQKTLVEQSDERTETANGRKVAGLAGVVVSVGLIISAVLTVIYLMLLVDDALGLPSPYGYLFGLLVGVVAIVPAEIALFVWMARLNSEKAITTAQRNIAVFAMIMAGIFSALTTSSFFSYFLPGLFPGSYMAIAPVLNVGAIVGSWVVFIMSVVAYGITSRSTRQNLAYAEVVQNIFDAKMDVVKAAGEAIRKESDDLIHAMNDEGLFAADGRQMVMDLLGITDERMALMAGEQEQQSNTDAEPEVYIMPAGTNPAEVIIGKDEPVAVGANNQNTGSNLANFPLT